MPSICQYTIKYMLPSHAFCIYMKLWPLSVFAKKGAKSVFSAILIEGANWALQLRNNRAYIQTLYLHVPLHRISKLMNCQKLQAKWKDYWNVFTNKLKEFILLSKHTMKNYLVHSGLFQCRNWKCSGHIPVGWKFCTFQWSRSSYSANGSHFLL